ncbi:hypothetical protein [Desulfovibrio sp. ZJ200]|uniref:hypothetical protein n=1 Tax=Desulfovibrio sp. ZJ200 TaxID=2709792 RepID=UPI0013EA5CA2|nr:hypothetical protein [Desulfovibrio sp. ZJ200]
MYIPVFSGADKHFWRRLHPEGASCIPEKFYVEILCGITRYSTVNHRAQPCSEAINMRFVAGCEQAQRSDFATAAVKLLSRFANVVSDSIDRDCKHRNIEHFAFEIIQFQKRRCHHFPASGTSA